MKDIDIKNSIAIYNNWVQSQEVKFNAISLACPYYKISLVTLKKLSPEHLKIFYQLAGGHNSYRPLWEQIFSQGDYRTEIKSEKIRGINFKIDKRLLKFSHESFFLNYAKSRGLFLPKFHFKWMLDNQLIGPLKTEGDEKLFSNYQLLILDQINWSKQSCLEYPNPQYYVGREILVKGKWTKSPGIVGDGSYTWQEYILNNKESIAEGQEKIGNLIYFLESMNVLDGLVFDKAFLDFQKLKRKYPEEKNYKINDIYNNLRTVAYKYYFKEFENKFKSLPLKIIKHWAVSTLPAWAIRHNPMLQLSEQLPILIKLLKSKEHATDTIFRKGNEIKLANFYVDIIKQLIFYIKIATNGKYRNDLNNLLSSPIINHQQICPICAETFTPNLSRNGGRKQLLCGKQSCDLEWSRNRQSKYRKKKK